jgi:hypothetical protein
MLTKIRSGLGAIIEKSSKKQSFEKPRISFPKPAYSPSTPSPKKKKVVERTPEKSSTHSTSTNSPGSVCTQKSNSPDIFGDPEEALGDTSGIEFERADIDYLVSMMEKSKTQNIDTSQLNISSRSSIATKTYSPKLIESKRKYSPSQDLNIRSPKKICKDSSFCRKKLNLELENSINLNESSPEKSAGMSSSQLLDFLEKSPPRILDSNENSGVEMFRNNLDCQEISPVISDVWENFDDCGYIPFMHPRISEAKKSFVEKVKSPESIITVSSGTASQNSNKSSQGSHTSTETLVNRTVRKNFLNDSVFEDADLSGLERAALNAYNKVISPLVLSPPTVSTPVNQPKAKQKDAVTPMADYSIMESPALQVHLLHFFKQLYAFFIVLNYYFETILYCVFCIV